MNSNFYVCNLCGKYSNGLMSNESFALIEVDLTDYFMDSCGLKLKEGGVHLHFCPKCFAKVKDSEAKVISYGSTEKIRRDIDKLEKEKQSLQEAFDDYKNQIKTLLTQ